METENKSYGKTKTNKTKRHIIYIAKMWVSPKTQLQVYTLKHTIS